jgi:hypothetical protein
MSLGRAAVERVTCESDLDAVLAKAELLMKDKKFAEAERCYTLAIREKPTEASLYTLRSVAAQSHANLSLAQSDALVLTLAYPGRPQSHERLADALIAGCCYTEAAAAAVRGMRCGNTTRNGQLSQLLIKARELGELPPVPWAAPTSAELFTWQLRSLQAYVFRGVLQLWGLWARSRHRIEKLLLKRSAT